MLNRLFFSVLFVLTTVFANSLSLNDNGDGTWGVGYQSSEAIGGFQFTVDGANVLSVSGGDAASNGFMLSSSGTTVIGFSLTGSTIPTGGGTLSSVSVVGTGN